jgi:hypothetical protein
MKVNPLFIPCPVCGVGANSYCRDLVTNAPTMTFHSTRVQAATE